MPVFDTAAHVQRIPTYSENRALRLQNEGQEIQNTLGRKEAENYDANLNLEKQSANLRNQELQQRIAENVAKMSERDQTIMRDSSTAGLNAYAKTNDTDAATEAMIDSIDAAIPGGRAEVLKKFPDLAFDPDTAGAVVSTLDEYNLRGRGGDVAGQQTKFIGDDGKAHVGTYNKETFEYTDANGRIHKNATPVSEVATQAELGGGAGTNQMGGKIREVMGSTDNLITSMDRIGTLVDDAPQASLGLPGAVGEFVDQAISAVDGFAEIAGGWAEINGEKVDSSALLDVRLYSDYFAGISGTNAAIEANAIGVAYALARAANPDGRISDADVRHQLERLQLNQSSKTRIKASISEVRREVYSSAINWLRTSGATKFPEGQEAFSRYSDALEAMDGSGGDVDTGGDVYSRAKAAIANGADAEAVKQRLIDLGHDPSKL